MSRILVVDDDPLNRTLLRLSMEPLGHTVVEAGDGIQALDVLAGAGSIDLVVTDVEMPEMDGMELLRHRQTQPELMTMPFIVISAVEEMDAIIECIRLGAEDFLPKPFDPVLLHARVGAALDRKRLTDELRELNEHLAERVDTKVREVERLNALRRFVSPQVAGAIVDGGAALATHRREITVLFCDRRGFTAFAETAEPEEVMEVLRDFHLAVGPMTFEHGGTIAQFTGDGMLVIFNDPVELDDPSWAAASLAVAMRDRCAELSVGWLRRGHDLQLGIGIAVGYATCGEIGFPGRTEYTAIGTVVNLSARICGIARGGQILATQRVGTAVGDRAAVVDLGPTEFKGLSRPVALVDLAPR